MSTVSLLEAISEARRFFCLSCSSSSNCIHLGVSDAFLHYRLGITSPDVFSHECHGLIQRTELERLSNLFAHCHILFELFS
jgi:hypothetical protein